MDEKLEIALIEIENARKTFKEAGQDILSYLEKATKELDELIKKSPMDLLGKK